MRNGIFSDGFTGVFGNALSGIFDDEFPSGALPDPRSVLADLSVTGPSGEGPAIDLPVDVFDFDMPDEALETAGSMTLSAAVETDFGPLYAPGGNGPGGGGPGGGGPGGGGGGGGGGGKKGPADYVSGDADTATHDNFNIKLTFSGDYSSTAGTNLVRYLQEAAEFLSDIITTGFADDPAMFSSTNTRKTFLVDDLYVEIKLGSFGIQPIGAETNVYAGNDWNGIGTVDTPAGATITFNTALLDALDSAGTLDDVALHEMLHALGFGLWEVMDNDLTDDSTGTLLYTGAGAYGTQVESEGLAGSTGSHWADAAYTNELMTSVIEDGDTMYLADFSIASLADLAVVNADNTEGYKLAGDWQIQLDALNGTGANDVGIDLDAWWAAIQIA